MNWRFAVFSALLAAAGPTALRIVLVPMSWTVDIVAPSSPAGAKAEKVERLDRAAPLPTEMQGRWIDAEDGSEALVIDGGEITCFGRRVNYDYKEIERRGAALTVSLKINDAAMEDSFQRANVTELAMSPDGRFFAYNVKFAIRLVRPRGAHRKTAWRG